MTLPHDHANHPRPVLAATRVRRGTLPDVDTCVAEAVRTWGTGRTICPHSTGADVLWLCVHHTAAARCGACTTAHLREHADEYLCDRCGAIDLQIGVLVDRWIPRYPLELVDTHGRHVVVAIPIVLYGLGICRRCQEVAA
jgi:hypothetical protein